MYEVKAAFFIKGIIVIFMIKNKPLPHTKAVILTCIWQIRVRRDANIACKNVSEWARGKQKSKTNYIVAMSSVLPDQ